MFTRMIADLNLAIAPDEDEGNLRIKIFCKSVPQTTPFMVVRA